MNVLHLSNTPLSNAPANLVHCLNHYGHRARLLLAQKSLIQRSHSDGELWPHIPGQELEHAFNTADVLHFHNYASEQKIFRQYPHLWAIAIKKPKIVQYHSARYSAESFERTLTDRSLKKAVIAQYHVRQYPECEHIVPNVLPIFKELYQPQRAKYDSPLPVVSYTPSNINCKGWDDKGWEWTKPALDDLERARVCSTLVMTGVPYEQCVRAKRWAWLGIDEVITGSYHLSSLEFAAMAAVPVARLDEQTLKAMAHVVPEEGMRSLPWINVQHPSQLKSAIHKHLLLPKMEQMRLGLEARTWMEKYWNPENHVKLWEGIYRSL